MAGRSFSIPKLMDKGKGCTLQQRVKYEVGTFVFSNHTKIRRDMKIFMTIILLISSCSGANNFALESSRATLRSCITNGGVGDATPLIATTDFALLML